MSNASTSTASSGFLSKMPLILAVVAATVGLGLEFTVLRGYGSHWWNHVPAFYLLWGGFAALVLLGISRMVSALLIGKEETHG
jgi:hypothetical protein